MKKRIAKLVPSPGADFSSYQGTINWTAAAKQIAFVFIKASEGETLVDRFFAQNWKGSKAAGVVRGPYHFFRPLDSVQEQVNNFVDAVGKLSPGDLPPVLDLEVPADWKTIPQAARVPLVIQWCEAVEKALGVAPILYFSPSFITDVLGTANSAPLAKYKLWIANYGVSKPDVPLPWTDWTFWQKSETGTVSGVNGEVDIDVYNGNINDMQSLVVQRKKRKKKGHGKKHKKNKHKKNRK
jgi:lysozyme